MILRPINYLSLCNFASCDGDEADDGAKVINLSSTERQLEELVASDVGYQLIGLPI